MTESDAGEAARAHASVTRRGMLLGGVAAAALAMAWAQDTHAVSAGGFGPRGGHPPLEPDRTAADQPKEETLQGRWPASSATARRSTAHGATPQSASSVLATPVFSLGDYVKRTPGAPAFPHNAVLLTIDDGPHPVWTPKILRLLQQYDVRATFCIIGRQATQYPALVRAAVSEGHHLANHTFSHPLGLPWLPRAAMTAQVVDAQDAIVRASGFTPRQFRAPGGRWSPQMMRLTAVHELLPVDWNIDSRDWSRPGSASIVEAMLAADPGDVLLCHDGGGDRSQTYEALKIVLPQLTARGLQFVTLPAPQPPRR